MRASLCSSAIGSVRDSAPAVWRGLKAADWEFTYSSAGTGLHALSRVFVADGRGYSLFFQTRASDDWQAALADFQQIAASFVPVA